MNSKKIIFSLLFLTLGLFGVAQEKINWTKINKVEKQMAKKENGNQEIIEIIISVQNVL